MIKILYALLFVIVFSLAQGIVYLIRGTTSAKEAKKKLSKVKNSSFVTRFVAEKQIELKKLGAKNIYLYISHCENVIDIDALKEAGITKVFTTNSIYRGTNDFVEVC